MKTTQEMISDQTDQSGIEIEYGEEILSAGWNPAIELACEMLQVPNKVQMTAAADLAALKSVEDVSAGVSEIFLKKIYTYQQ